MHQISVCVCLFPHKISALHGIGLRHSMPVERLGGHVLRGMTIAALRPKSVIPSSVLHGPTRHF